MDKSLSHSEEDENSGNAAAERGKEAIEAHNVNNPKPKEEFEDAKKKDAEQWRNEG